MRRGGDWSFLRDAAHAMGISLSRLAILLDVEPQTVHNWVNGRNDPPLRLAQKLAYVLGFDALDALLDKANFDKTGLLAELDAQFRGMNVTRHLPAVHDEASSLIALSVPHQPLVERNHPLASEAERLIVTANDLLWYQSQFRAARDQARAVLTHMVGRTSGLSARLWFNVANAEILLGNYSAAVLAADAARTAGHGRVSAWFMADTHVTSGDALRCLSEHDDADTHYLEAYRLYEKADAPYYAEMPMWTDWSRARIFALSGNTDKALELYARMDDVLKLRQHFGGPEMLAWSVGYVHEVLGDYARALEHYREAKRLSHAPPVRVYYSAMASWRIAELLRKQGRLAEAVGIARATMTEFESIGNDDMALALSLVVAYCELHLGQLDHAATLLREFKRCTAHSEDLSYSRFGDMTERYLALAAYASTGQRIASSLSSATPDRAPAHAVRLSLRNELLDELSVAETLRVSGKPRDALWFFDDVLQRSVKSRFPPEEAHAWLGIAEAKRMSGEPDLDIIAKASRLYRQIGCAWGAIHALIATALADASQFASSLRDADTLAEQWSFGADRELIRHLKADTAAANRHALIFA